MPSLQDLVRRIAHTDELHDIIGAVRALAAARLRRAHDGIEASRAYAAIVGEVLRGVLPAVAGDDRGSPAAAPRRVLTIAFGSQHGFVGGYNDDIVAAVTGLPGPVWMVGDRATAVARESDLPIAAGFPMATRVASVDDLARALAREIVATARDVDAVDLTYLPYGSERTAVSTRRLLPLDPGELGAPTIGPPPLRYMSAGDLVARFAEEYLLSQLASAAMESFASENRARLRQMDQTYESIERRLDGLRREARHARQEEITTELLDIITGAEAQRTSRDR